jgi:hypothetical protein
MLNAELWKMRLCGLVFMGHVTWFFEYGSVKKSEGNLSGKTE